MITLTAGANAQYQRLIGREKQLLKEKRTEEALQLADSRDQLVPYLGDSTADTVRTLQSLRPSAAALEDARKQGSLSAKILGALTWAGAVALGAAMGGEAGFCLGALFGWVPGAMVGTCISDAVQERRKTALKHEALAQLAGQLSDLPAAEVVLPTSEQMALGFNRLAQSYQEQGLTQVSGHLHQHAEWLLTFRPGRDAHQLFEEARQMHPLDDRKHLLFDILQRGADLPAQKGTA
jgi:hypothetical protein